MGVAQLPWFLTKVLVPLLYSGCMMDRYCPAPRPAGPSTPSRCGSSSAASPWARSSCWCWRRTGSGRTSRPRHRRPHDGRDHRDGRTVPPVAGHLPVRGAGHRRAAHLRQLLRLRLGRRAGGHPAQGVEHRPPGHRRALHALLGRRHPGRVPRRHAHRPDRHARRQPGLLGAHRRRRLHRRAGAQRAGCRAGPAGLRRRQRVAGGGAERHPGALVQGQGAGLLVRLHPGHRPAGDAVQLQHRGADRQPAGLADGAVGGGRPVRPEPARQPGLLGDGPARREGAGPGRGGLRRQDRLRRHQEVRRRPTGTW